MIKKVKKQFVLFAALIMSIVIGLTLLFSYTRISGPHFHRYVLTAILLILVVVAGSMILSGLAVRPIQKTWQQQLDFTADASHELRTPLAAIRSNLEIVMEAKDATVEEQMKWLNNIDAESKRMSQMVEALLTLSRADTGANPPVLEDFPLDALIRHKLEVMEPMAKAKAIMIQSDIPENFILHADPAKIEQVLTILMDNAIKYMGRPGTLSLCAKSIKKGTQIEVTDTGVGMNANDLCHLFQRFYRADQSRNSKISGTGLGLSIAQMLIAEHHGTIDVQSTQGKGTTFIIYLPSSFKAF